MGMITQTMVVEQVSVLQLTLVATLRVRCVGSRRVPCAPSAAAQSLFHRLLPVRVVPVLEMEVTCARGRVLLNCTDFVMAFHGGLVLVLCLCATHSAAVEFLSIWLARLHAVPIWYIMA